MEWNEDFLTGIPEVDAQHRGLLWIASKVLQRASEGTVPSGVSSAIGSLARSFAIHFDLEESLMQLHQYPQFREHCLEHRQFLEKLKALYQQSKENPISAEMITLGTEWLYGHIVAFDKEMASFLEAKGAVSKPGIERWHGN